MKAMARWIGGALGLMLLSACDGEGGVPASDAALAQDGTAPIAVTIRFEARVGDRPFLCGGVYDGVGATATTWEPQDFRLYVHDVRLMRGAQEVPLALDPDGTWQHEGIALLDFEDRTGLCGNGTDATNATVRGTAPAGPYDGLRFRIGIPEASNHLDVATAPSPLNLAGMYWNWTGGYKFLRIDGRTAGQPGFNVHLGSTMCQPGGEGGPVTCARANVPEVALTGGDPLVRTVALDFAALVAEADLDANTPGTPAGCMSAPDDPECPPIFGRLGLGQDGSADAAAQRFATW